MINFLDFFSRKSCIGCGQNGYQFCPHCLSSLKKFPSVCYFCKKETENFMTHQRCFSSFPLEQVYVFHHYKNSITQKCIHRVKYFGEYSLLQQYIDANIEYIDDFFISPDALFVPVPIHIWRRFQRGYNQSLLLAKKLGKIYKVPVCDMLKKTKHTSKQSHLSKNERMTNIRGVFEMKKVVLQKDVPIYLIDDVISTGSTLSECALLLRRYGYSDIRAIVLASD